MRRLSSRARRARDLMSMLVLFPLAAQAAVADGVDTGDSGDAGVETIVVQAQRRAQRAADVPLALTVVTGEAVRAADQIKHANDILQFVPNASAAATEGPERPRWFIRGIGTNNTGANTVNPIGIYYDDVYIANVYAQGAPLFDLDHVEVLNGPQGTLWGKNSNGGAIAFLSKQPIFEFDGYGKVGFGSYNERQVQGAVNAPLIGDKVAARLSVYYDDAGGFQKNRTDGKHLGGGREFAVRGQVLFRPIDDLRILVNAHYRNFDGTTRPFAYYKDSVTPLTPGTAAQQAFLSVFPQGLPQTRYGEVNLFAPGIERLEGKGITAKVTWDPGAISLVSITAYESNRRNQTQSFAALPASSPYAGTPFTATDALADYWQVSQELRLASPNDQRVTWLAGLYGFYERLDSQSATANYIRGTVPTANAWGVTAPQYASNPFSQSWNSFAAFGNVGVQILDGLKLSGGVRVSRERTTFENRYLSLNSGSTAATFLPNLPRTNIRSIDAPTVFADRQTQGTTSWTYDITPEYRVSENVLGYFRYAHGVLPGNFTTTGWLPVPGRPGVRAVQVFRLNPEELDAYEVGAKTSWFDKRLQVDATLFHYDYTNAVVNVPTVLDPANPTATTVLFRNAGAARVNGAEIRFDAQPLTGLHLGGSFGWLDTKYTQDTGTTATILGAQAPRSPHYTVNGYASYEQKLPNDGSLVYAVDANWRSKQFYYPTVASQITNPDPLLAQSAYAIVNAHLTWNVLADGKLALELSVRNLFDKEYSDHGLPVSNGSVDRRLGTPRTAFLSLNARFP